MAGKTSRYVGQDGRGVSKYGHITCDTPLLMAHIRDPGMIEGTGHFKAG